MGLNISVKKISGKKFTCKNALLKECVEAVKTLWQGKLFNKGKKP